MSESRQGHGRQDAPGVAEDRQTQGTVAVSAETAGDQKMAQLRELMFGGVTREFDRRLRDLETRMTSEAERLSTELDRRIVGLEVRLVPQIEKLAEQLRQETDARNRAMDDAEDRHGKALRTLREELGATLRSHERESEQAATRHREALAEVQAEMQGAVIALRQSLVGTRDELGQQKLAREDFADMLAELALRLRLDGQPPAG